MTAEIPKPVEIRKTKGYLVRRIVSKWPFLVWLGVALLTYKLYQRGVRFERMNGVVVAETQVVAAPLDGTIKAMSVAEIGEPVAANQVVVELDERIAVSQLELRERELEFEKIEQSRKYDTMRTEAMQDIAKLQAAWDGDVARLEVLNEGLTELKDRVDKGLIPASKYKEAVDEAKLLEVTLPTYGDQMAALQEQLTSAEALIERLAEFNKTPSGEIAAMREQIERMKLISVSGGTVSAIYFRAGSVVERGEPIAEIIDLKSRAVRGFIVEQNAEKVSVGRVVYISPTGEATAQIYPGKITFISPQITSTPDIGSSVAGRMIKGREITCGFDSPDVELLPGQSVTIHLEKPGKFKLFSLGEE